MVGRKISVNITHSVRLWAFWVGGWYDSTRLGVKLKIRGFLCVLEIISILLIFSFLTAQNVTELLQWLRMAVIPCFGAGTMT